MYNFICFQNIYLTSIYVDVDFSENIKKYYHRSSSAEKRINETTSIINNSEKTRIDLLTLLDTLTSKENLSLEKLKQIEIPDIQILKEKVNIHTVSKNVLWLLLGLFNYIFLSYILFIFYFFCKCINTYYIYKCSVDNV